MNELQARSWLQHLDVSRETLSHLDDFVALLQRENTRQNLVSKQSLDAVWERHIVDSAQLIRLAPPSARTWLDLGTGAGFPGLIAALLHRSKFTLVEERKLRCGFLADAAALLGVGDRTTIVCDRIERVSTARYDVISARAFAPLDRLLALGERFAGPDTRWILPKGKNAKSELEAALASWQGDFRLEPSLTDAEAQIIVAERVRHRSKGKTRE